ncbi:TonB-dependent receptor domain-containing protein [Novosphingobium rosa]|uniref:TonB-dependent receptor domain-containing protein n=1 Tax=Novosphingobium rosa TaxID=76978 RepID=UPI00082E67FD|nr:TonB-dependent receptor [Novosphingobium rosa]
MNTVPIRRALRASTGLLAVACLTPAVYAQDTAKTVQIKAPDTASTPDREIIVTGSRLVTNGNSAPTPVTVASVDTLLKAQPAGVIEGLNTLPGLLGSINTTSNVNTGGFNTLNLRGIGSTRGLVLVDGRRVGSTQTRGEVDVDVIPQALLKRVDVVTGGASAAYGSEAVSGVVNFITDTKFVGLKTDLHSGISNYGDDRKIGGSLAWGANFNDGRGHFEASYEYADNAGFLRSSRPFLNNWASMTGSGTAASPYTLVYGARLNNYAYGGYANTGLFKGLQFGPGGALTTFTPGTPTLSSSVNIGGDGAYFQGATAGAAAVNHRAMARFDYDVTDSIHGHVTGILSKFKQSYTQQNPQYSVLIGYNNPYLANAGAGYQATIAAQPAGSSFTLNKMDLQLPMYQYNVLNSYYNVDAGLDGKLGKFDWSVDAYRSENAQTTRNNNGINLARFYAATNAVSSGGKTVCNAALTNPTYANCVPLNVLGTNTEQAAAIAYVEQPIIYSVYYSMTDFNANIKGSLFHLPAGDVKAVVMGEWRRLTYAVGSNASPSDAIDCAGIQFNCSNTAAALRYLGGQTAVRTPVSQIVKEVATEVEVPVLADKPFFKALNLNGAVRYTNYNTSGDAWTWKGGAVWNVSDQLTLRVTRSRDIRAPNLYDLYQPATIATTNYVDIHTGNTAGVIGQQSQGNPNLTPEKADTLTLGGVIKPHFLPGFSLSVDYYKIKIKNALVGITGMQPATQTACEQSGGTASVCSLYVRPFPFSNTTAANFPTLLYSQTLNVASLTTHGVDFEMDYAHPIANHAFSARALVTYQPTLLYNNGPAGQVDVGGAADGVGGLPPIAKWKIVGSINFDPVEKVHVMVQERWRSSLRQNGTLNNNGVGYAYVFANPPVPSIGYTDLNFSVDVARNFNAFLNIQNLFNSYPPVYASAGGTTQMNYLGGFAQGDDIEGRYFTVGVKWKM